MLKVISIYFTYDSSIYLVYPCLTRPRIREVWKFRTRKLQANASIVSKNIFYKKLQVNMVGEDNIKWYVLKNGHEVEILTRTSETCKPEMPMQVFGCDILV